MSRKGVRQMRQLFKCISTLAKRKPKRNNKQNDLTWEANAVKLHIYLSHTHSRQSGELAFMKKATHIAHELLQSGFCWENETELHKYTV